MLSIMGLVCCVVLVVVVVVSLEEGGCTWVFEAAQ